MPSDYLPTSASPHALTQGRQWGVLALLAALAVAINYQPFTVFFDIQVLLGGSLGVLAVLGFGLWGLPVGVAAALVTVELWGHPWAALGATLELLWLAFFLARLNGGPGQRDNGRVVLADTVYWVFFGVAFETLLYSQAMSLPVQDTFLIAAKQGVNGVIQTLTGFVLYLLAGVWLLRRASTSPSSPRWPKVARPCHGWPTSPAPPSMPSSTWPRASRGKARSCTSRSSR
jgi:hypothetical protein